MKESKILPIRPGRTLAPRPWRVSDDYPLKIYSADEKIVCELPPSGKVDAEYIVAMINQSVYFLPCPHCGKKPEIHRHGHGYTHECWEMSWAYFKDHVQWNKFCEEEGKGKE